MAVLDVFDDGHQRPVFIIAVLINLECGVSVHLFVVKAQDPELCGFTARLPYQVCEHFMDSQL